MLLEIILTVIVIIGILLLVGVSPLSIVNLLLNLIGTAILLTVAFVVLFFIGTDIFLLLFRRVKGTFVRIDEEGRFDHAVYQVEGTEYSCIFPAESVGRKHIYKGGSYTLLIPRFGKRKIAYDRHSLVIIIFGTIASAALIGLCCLIAFQVMGF